MSRKVGVESGRRRSMTPKFFFEFHIRILKVIYCRSKKFIGLEITGPYLLKRCCPMPPPKKKFEYIAIFKTNFRFR